MSIAQHIIGIDVSKQHLDLFDSVSKQSRRIPNEASAIAAYFSGLGDQAPKVVFEATGAYDRALREALQEAGVVNSRVNPAHARDFARALGYLAKTDAMDARMLAQMGSRLELELSVLPSPEQEALSELHRRRDQLVLMRAQEKTRLSESGGAKDSLLAHIVWLDESIKDFDRQIAALIAKTPAFCASADLLRSVPGIGPVAVATLLAQMPELGHRSRRGIAALAGLAPMNADSGSKRGQRVIRGGRARVRTALYMAAVAAIRSNEDLKAFYWRLKAQGKAAKVALIAVARKILVIANAILRSQEPYRA